MIVNMEYGSFLDVDFFSLFFLVGVCVGGGGMTTAIV